jgi:hypothetical protein
MSLLPFDWLPHIARLGLLSFRYQIFYLFQYSFRNLAVDFPLLDLYSYSFYCRSTTPYQPQALRELSFKMTDLKATPGSPLASDGNPCTDLGLNGVAPDIEKKAGPGSIEDAQQQKDSAFKSLGLLDRFLALWIFLAMLIGILLGNFVENVGPALQKGKFVGVSVPIGKTLPPIFKL